jgi:hypothetical protein
VARLGGTIDFRQEDQLNVTMPREAVAALRADPLVRYIQALAGASDAALIGEPEEPTPGAPRRLVPHATAGNQSWSRSYSYDGAGNITNIGSQQFVYDELGRLKEMATSGTMTEQYGYDRYGNQTSRNSGGVLRSIVTEPATNRLSAGYAYDSAGNVISGDGYTLFYDTLGQAAAKTYTDTTTATTFNETYIYTASEERIGVQASNSRETSSWLYWSVRDEGGKVLRQYRSSALDPAQTALWIEDYVYRDGLLVGAERPPTLGGRRHFHLDHLGSPRLITSNDGQIVSMHDYLPFGGESTSVWQETGAGFDREVLSPDRVGGMAPNPQSWNRYTYGRNNPIGMADPDGNLALPWHIAISFAAARHHGLSLGRSISLAWKVGMVDFRRNSQSGDARFTNMHAMRGTKASGIVQTVAEGRAGTARSISDSLARGDLSAAMHTTQDNQTPRHQDEVWTGSYFGLGVGGAIAHFLADLFPAPSTVTNAYADTVNLLASEESFDNSQNVPQEPDVQASDSWLQPAGSSLLHRYYIRPGDYNDPFRGTGFCDASNTGH